MNPRKELIKKLSQNENITFLLELNDMLPEILIEIQFNILENKIEFNEKWNDFKMIRSYEILYVSKDEFNASNYFQFAIYVGYPGTMLFGVIGPWDKKDLFEDIKAFYESCQKIGLVNWMDKYRNNWMYKYFSKDNTSLFNLIRNGQTTDSAIIPYINEFFIDCLKLKTELEKLNKTLQNI